MRRLIIPLPPSHAVDWALGHTPLTPPVSPSIGGAASRPRACTRLRRVRPVRGGAHTAGPVPLRSTDSGGAPPSSGCARCAGAAGGEGGDRRGRWHGACQVRRTRCMPGRKVVHALEGRNAPRLRHRVWGVAMRATRSTGARVGCRRAAHTCEAAACDERAAAPPFPARGGAARRGAVVVGVHRGCVRAHDLPGRGVPDVLRGARAAFTHPSASGCGLGGGIEHGRPHVGGWRLGPQTVALRRAGPDRSKHRASDRRIRWWVGAGVREP